jgi:hypothetical protein
VRRMSEPEEQTWFEMRDIRKHHLDSSVWIPVRAVHKLRRESSYGRTGYVEEFFGAGSVMVPLDQRAAAEKLDWARGVGISHSHEPYVQDGKYHEVDAFEDRGISGVHLVIDQRGNSLEEPQWHLSLDFIAGMGLKREGDEWLAIHEGYVSAARLHRDEDGRPIRVEVRAEYLKDYLCARGMALYVNTYNSRAQSVANASHILWPDDDKDERDGLDHWRGQVYAIHEGGMPFGESTAVFHMARTDIGASDDVPVMGPPTDDNISSSTWTKKDERPRLLIVRGELWRSQWVEPGRVSVRLRHDDPTSPVMFIVDAAGRQEPSKSFVSGDGRWLWFLPDVIAALAHRRGGLLQWFTRYTGDVRCSPDYRIDFGINALGLVNVYAKDIGLLPDWQQRIWAGFNVSPDGGVSDELLASQVRAEPADTKAPEEYLDRGLSLLNHVAIEQFGFPIIRPHEQRDVILRKAHRFRAVDESGLFALAKDVARLTADSIDAAALQKIVAPPKGERWRSLKSLEKVLATKVGAPEARRMMGPLVGAFDLRHADAHLPSDDQKECFRLLGIDPSLPFPEQGRQLLHACVSALYEIAGALRKALVPEAAQTEPEGNID